MQEKPTGKRGVAYLRVSDDDQDPETQRATIERWLEKHGLTVGRWYVDKGWARHLADRRPEFQRMVRAVEAGKIDWIIVSADDRFGTRNSYQFGTYAEMLQDHGCELWSVADGHLTARDEMTEIVNSVRRSRSTNEQIKRSERSWQGKIPDASKGIWQGGVPPYGFDVGVFGKDGQERWRIQWLGPRQRLKIWPKKMKREPERFDGAMPKHEADETLHLVPSCDKDRIRVVQLIFRTFATEAITIRGLATKLHELGISPIVSPTWLNILHRLLENPAYVVGATVYNKKSCSQFKECHGPKRELVSAPIEKGRKLIAKQGRKRPQTDWIVPEGDFEALIDQKTWEKVQARLGRERQRAGTGKRRARTNDPNLWLSGLVYCGQCGKAMSGWSRTEPSYACPTYRKYAKSPANTTGCWLHRVTHSLLESLLRDHLISIEAGLAVLLTATPEQARELYEDPDHAIVYEKKNGKVVTLEDKKVEYMRLYSRLAMQVCRAKVPMPDRWTWEAFSKLYRRLVHGQNAEIEKELAVKHAELEKWVERYGTVDGDVAVKLAKSKVETLSREVEELQRQLQPLDEQAQALRQELEDFQGRMAATTRALREDPIRRKALAVTELVNKITCWFDHVEEGHRSILSRVRVELASGEACETGVPAAVVPRPASGTGAAVRRASRATGDPG
jgi:DNA invertase Pin-like site-specific DNA recombinase